MPPAPETVVGVDPDQRAIEAATRLYGERAGIVRRRRPPPRCRSRRRASASSSASRRSSGPLAPALPALGRLLAPDGVLFVSLPLDPSRDRSTARRCAGARAHRLGGAGRCASPTASSCAAAGLLGAAPRPRGRGAGRILARSRWLGSEPGEDRSVLIAAATASCPTWRRPPRWSARATCAPTARPSRPGSTGRAGRRPTAPPSTGSWSPAARRSGGFASGSGSSSTGRCASSSGCSPGRRAKLGEGPPIRPPEREQDAWN